MNDSYVAIYLPYAVQKLSKGWIPVNRLYKPLGLAGGRLVNYEDTPLRSRIKAISSSQQQRLWHGNQRIGGLKLGKLIHLHEGVGGLLENEEGKWESYLERLGLLARLKCFDAQPAESRYPNWGLSTWAWGDEMEREAGQ